MVDSITGALLKKSPNITRRARFQCIAYGLVGHVLRSDGL